MGQQLIIREAMEEDEIMLRCIYNACMERDPWASDYRLYTENAMHSFFEEKKEKGYPVLVAVMGGRLVGFISAKQFTEWKTEGNVWEYGVYVDGTCRRMGVATALLESLCTRAVEEGVESLMACIDVKNVPSLWFHENRGFVSVGSFTKWRKEGESRTVVLYELSIA